MCCLRFYFIFFVCDLLTCDRRFLDIPCDLPPAVATASVTACAAWSQINAHSGAISSLSSSHLHIGLACLCFNLLYWY